MEQRKRVITAVIGIPIFLLLVYLGGWWLGVLTLLLGIVGFAEYYQLVQRMHPASAPVWLLLGFGYIALGLLSFFGTRVLGGTLWLLLIVWATDIAAYEVGRRIGRTKLAPTISPNKTVEGFIAGLLGGLLIGLIYGLCFMKAGFVASLLIPLFISLLGQLGDLLESKVKRLAGVKDSGRLFPGHGGVLDRFDSLLLTSPFMYLLLLIIR